LAKNIATLQTIKQPLCKEVILLYLCSPARYILAKVNVVKQTTSTIFAGIDSGFNYLIRQMLYGSQHHIENISHPKSKERFYTVIGYICETDTFAKITVGLPKSKKAIPFVSVMPVRTAFLWHQL
jgi:hypothetical protein